MNPYEIQWRQIQQTQMQRSYGGALVLGDLRNVLTGTTYTNSNATFTVAPLSLSGSPPPPRAVFLPEPGPAIAWLDRRVDELRVRL